MSTVDWSKLAAVTNGFMTSTLIRRQASQLPEHKPADPMMRTCRVALMYAWLPRAFACAGQPTQAAGAASQLASSCLAAGGASERTCAPSILDTLAAAAQRARALQCQAVACSQPQSRAVCSAAASAASQQGAAPQSHPLRGGNHRDHCSQSHNHAQHSGVSGERTNSDRSAKIDPANESVFTAANCISLARLASAPLLGWWLLTEQWHLCLPGLVLAGTRHPLHDHF